MAVSLLLSAPMALFLPASFDAPWIIIWAVFFGWMAVWGGIEVANGLGAILESKSRLRLLGLTGKEQAIKAKRYDELSTGPLSQTPIASDAFRSPSSVTEGTTRHLDEE